MKNEFESKWVELLSKGHAAGRYRVYPDHLLNFYVQYSLAGYREVVIEVLGENILAPALPEFRNIQLISLEIPRGIRIGITLLDSDLAKNFSMMCYEMAERSSAADAIKPAFTILLTALANWAELFKTKTSDGLTREEVLGLFGELLVLESLLLESKINPETLILGWRGPYGDTRDIGVNGIRIEVKTQRSTSALKLRISSLTQLDDHGDQIFIALLRLSPSEKGRTLIELVDSINHSLKEHTLATLEFARKIILTGMDVNSELSREPYAVDDQLAYRVTSNFPRLIPGNVPVGISNAQYEIAGPPLDTFRAEWGFMIGAVNG